MYERCILGGKNKHMGASISIVGVHHNSVLELLPDYYAEIKEKYKRKPIRFSVEDLHHLFYETLYEVVYDKRIDNGLTSLFENAIKVYSREIHYALSRYFSDFDHWNNDLVGVEKHDCSYIMDHTQFMGLMDWFAVLQEEGWMEVEPDTVLSGIDYPHRDRALFLLKEDMPEMEFFRHVWYDYEKIKMKAGHGSFSYYFFTYSF